MFSEYSSFLIFWVGLAFIITGSFLTFLYVRIILKSLSAINWTKVRGLITKSVLQKSGTRRKRKYKALIQYEYQVKGKTYTSNRINLSKASRKSSSRRRQKKKVRKYSKGSQVRVYVNPRNPKKTILETGIKSTYVLSLFIACLLIVLGLTMVFSKYWMNKF